MIFLSEWCSESLYTASVVFMSLAVEVLDLQFWNMTYDLELLQYSPHFVTHFSNHFIVMYYIQFGY